MGLVYIDVHFPFVSHAECHKKYLCQRNITLYDCFTKCHTISMTTPPGVDAIQHKHSPPIQSYFKKYDNYLSYIP